MKKIILSILFALSFLGASRSVAASELGERITKMLAIARYTGPLTAEQQREFREWLDDVADERGLVEEDVARAKYETLLAHDHRPAQAGPAEHAAGAEAEDKEEQEPKNTPKIKGSNLQDPRLSKKGASGGMPAAVWEHVGSFLPSGYVVPLAWDIQFPQGQRIVEFARIPLGRKYPFYSDSIMGYKTFAVSPDGRYVALALNKVHVWNMQHKGLKAKEVGSQMLDIDYYKLAIDSQGRLGYFSGFEGRIGVIDIATGKVLWNEKGRVGAAPAFSADGKYFIDIALLDDWRVPDKKPYLVRDAATGQRVELQSLEWSGDISREMTYSFDGTKKIIKDDEGTTLSLEEKVMGQWQPYYKIPLGNKHYGDRMYISPQGLKLCLVYPSVDEGNPNYRVAIDIVDLTGRVDSPTILAKNFIGGNFSPDGHHFMWAYFEPETQDVVLKVFDVFGYFRRVEEYEGAEKHIRELRQKLE